jgi:hypothetical protein
MSRPPVQYHEIIVTFGKADTLEIRREAISRAVDFYSPKNGYQIVEGWLEKEGYSTIDDFASDNIRFADHCVIRYVKLSGFKNSESGSSGRPDLS